MIEILIIGDRLAEGDYTVHSRFGDVVNFERDGVLASIASERIGAGPLNIVARGVDFESLDAMQIGERRLSLDGREFPYEMANSFASGIDRPDEIDSTRFRANLLSFEKTLCDYSPHKSLAFLLDSRRQGDFVTSFDGQFAKRMKAGAELLFGPDYLGGVRMIRGLGYGLTPSGDDFLAGVLLAYNIAGGISEIDYAERIDTIYMAAIGENLISNASLICAKKGWMTERQKALVSLILNQKPADVKAATIRLMQIGRTSGADWGVGLLMTLKKVYGLA